MLKLHFLLFPRWKVGPWSKCYACKNLSGVRVREVVCIEESPKEGAEDILLEDGKCEGVRPASRELCKSKKVCRSVRIVDEIPDELMRDVSDQIDRTSLPKRQLVSINVQQWIIYNYRPHFYYQSLY